MLADGVGHRRQSQSKCLWALLSLQMVLRRGAAVLGATAGHRDSVGAGEVERSSWLQSRQHGARLSCALLARARAAERAPVPLRQVPLRHLRRVPRIKLTACSLPCVWSRRATIVPSYFGPALCASLSKWQRSSSSCASTMLSEYGLTKTHSSKLLRTSRLQAGEGKAGGVCKWARCDSQGATERASSSWQHDTRSLRFWH